MQSRVLGIDPGTTRIGYGLIEKTGMTLQHIESGLLPVSPIGRDDAERLMDLQDRLARLIKRLRPDIVGVEKLFFTKNKKTAMRVSEARGVILKTAAESGAQIIEISPAEAKIAVTGNGRAEKAAVAKMINFILKIPPRKVVDDVTDALAIAVAASSSGRR
jgi:crossover junction endodeoxyribonuclease RuvC